MGNHVAAAASQFRQPAARAVVRPAARPARGGGDVRRAGLGVAAWGAVLIIHSIVLLIWVGIAYSSMLLLASGLAAVATGLAVAWRGSSPGRMALVEVSLPAVLLAVGVFTAAG